MKVAQLTGYTAQTTGYHHGEAALNGTIIGMAQDFVGSNNINLLQPIGQFGSRLAGGKDAAAPRYIFTCLSSTTRKVYIKEDEQVLEYLDDEGMTIEPKYFAPIIPMVLVNGATGIATAFSTSIPSHDPRELIAVLRLILEHGARDQPDPKIWYRGHKGGIEEDASGKLTSVGVFTRTGPTKIKVTELPIMTWTEDFKQLLEDALDSKAGLIKNYKSNYDNEKVDFDIEFASAQALDDLMASSNASTGYSKLHHELKLISTRALQKSNMYLFDAQGRIKKYATTMEIVNDFVDTRLELYDKRKQAVIASLKNNIKFLEAKARFINEVITKKVTLSDVKRADVEAQLQKGEYPTLEDGYEYLLRMPMSSLTHERKLQLEAEAAKARQELTKLQKTSPKDMWLAELAELEAAL
jgi:DNA topoisomerase-2